MNQVTGKVATGKRASLYAVFAAMMLTAIACGGDDEGSGTPGSGSNPPTPVPVLGSAVPQIVATPAPPEVRVADIAGRRILTDIGGFTLYTFADDNAGDGKSACNGVCRNVWPPFVIDGTAITAPPEIAANFSTITRLDKTTQVTYNGKPLYRFRTDVAPGDLTGDGFGEGAWTAAQP